jgi:hypothetical protein
MRLCQKVRIVGTDVSSTPALGVQRPTYLVWLLPAVAGSVVALAVANVIAPQFQETPPSWGGATLLSLEQKGAALQGEIDSLTDQRAQLGLACQGSGRPPPSSSASTSPPPPSAQPTPQPQSPPAQHAEAPPSGSTLVIPPDAKATKKVDFMEGCWKSQASLVSRANGRPIIVDYCFDANGNGKRKLQEAGGLTCTGRAKATMSANGDLFITDVGPAACSDGQSGYSANTIQCSSGAEGRADCHGESSSNNKWDASFHRL